MIHLLLTKGGLLFHSCPLFLCSLLAQNNTPLCTIYLLLALYFLFTRFAKKGKKIIFFYFSNYFRLGVFIFRSRLCLYSLASLFLFAVACSVELRSYGGLARRGTLSTFVPIQFAAPVSILSKIHARPDALNADVTIGNYLRCGFYLAFSGYFIQHTILCECVML